MKQGGFSVKGRWIVVVTAVIASLVTAGVGAGFASAAPPICDDPEDPGCGGGETQTFTNTLTVTTPAQGRVGEDGGLVSCGAGATDCTHSVEYTRECDFGVCGDPEPAYVTLTLTATNGPPGFSPVWSGCSPQAGTNRCDVTLDDDRTVSLSWADTTNPNISFSPPAKSGPSTVMTASASDNAGVSRVEFLVGGVVRGTDNSAPFEFNFPASLFTHGSSHEIRARAVDTSERSATSAAGLMTTVDRQVALALGASPAAGGYTNAATAPLSFTTDADVLAAGRQCRLDGGAFSQCSSPFSLALPEGQRTYTVRVTDDVGNTTSASRTFTVDRTAPAASFTAGPDEGAIVGTGTVSFGFSSSDSAPLSRSCRLDGAPFGACSGEDSHTLNDLANGEHVFSVRVLDAAGNERVIHRNFAVQRAVGGGGGGGEGGAVEPSDSRPPALTARPAEKPLKQKKLWLLVESDEAAALTVTPKRSSPVVTDLEAGREEMVSAKLGKSALRSIAKALRDKGKAKLPVALQVRDASGNAAETSLMVKFKRRR
jgi:hypothetical protein